MIERAPGIFEVELHSGQLSISEIKIFIVKGTEITDAAMEYFKAEVMELCHRENLYQIDLLHGSKNRITEREYWAQRKGQAKLDKEAAALPAEEQPAKPTKFETDKEKLRQTIRTALSSAASYGEFTAVLLQQGVTVKESRGRLSYLTPDRTKPITARKLGDDFDRTAVLALLEQNAHRAAEQTATVPEYLGSKQQVCRACLSENIENQLNQVERP